MGYRSEVKSCIYSDDIELLDAFIAGRKLIDDLVFSSENDGFGGGDSLTYHEKIYTHTDGVVQTIKILDLHGMDWKWYEEYESVKAWHKLLEDAETAGLNYEFVRVGEEDGDIDYQSGGEHVEGFLSTSTNIFCDY